MQQIGHWIDGRAAAGSGRTGPVYDPATGRQQAEVALASTEDVSQVVASAARAQVGWRATPLSARAEVMFRFRELLDANRKLVGEAITAENGKTPADADGELQRGLENVEFATGLAHLLRGTSSEQVSRGVDVRSIRQPLGVVAGITPFNFPAMVPLWMIPTAIACGNAFVLKPSEKDPSPSLILADLFAQAGLPPGVLSVVQGDAEAVDALLTHPDVAALSFVGSTAVARHVYETGTKNGKRVQALGGAKNHMVVLPDADLGLAADAAVSAAYGSAGERCMAVSVVVAVGGIGDALVEAIESRVQDIAVGPGSDPGSQMGPLITGTHRDAVAAAVGAAESDGATVRVDGRTAAAAGGEGFFLGPTLLDDVKPGTDAQRTEIFGPVLSVVRVPDYAAALEVVESTPYGNGTAIFTRDGGAAARFADEVSCGMVGVNVPIPVPVATHSFGGWKSSLFGDLHMYGPEGIAFFTRAKVVTTRWPDPSTSAVDLGFPRNR